MKPSTKTMIWVNAFAFAGVLIVNYLANALPLNGKNTGELSDQYPNLFTPAGLTFSIWGVIYVWLLVFVVYQVLAKFKTSLAIRINPIVDKVGWYFIATCVFNIAWIFAWHWEQLALSVLIMLGFLVTLLRMNEQLGIGHFKSNPLEKRIAHLPFGIYQGWITVATIANFTALLVSNGWQGGGLSESTWTVGMILIGAFIALFILFRQNNLGHGLAVAWAFLGIYLKRIDAAEMGSEMVAYTAIGAMGLVLVVTLSRWRAWTAY